ncbi:hypothetical protein BH11BAC2_BH11BAC2_14470 [soil metagenome]
MKNSLLIIILVLAISSCKNDKYTEPPVTNYPADVEKILVANCATSGCHNTASKDAAAGLDLSSWDKMFEGTNNGAVTIPFRTDFSTLLYFTNTDSTLGLVSEPRMPVNGAALSKADYLLLKDWIFSGAPDKNGNIKFSGDPLRHKYYVSNQGCDVVSVFDADKNVVMRMVDVGLNAGASPPESPHNVRVTADGKYWVVVFLNSDNVQVYSTETDALVSNISIGNGIAGAWNTVTLSSDSKMAYAVDYNLGRVAIVDLIAGTSTTIGPFPITGSAAPNLHGSALNKTNDTLYVTCQELSKIIKIPLNNFFDYQDINLQGTQPLPFALKPHEVAFSPDFTKYFVTCQDTNVNQVRVYNASNDQLIAAIPVGRYPLEMSISPSKNLLFVTNQEDNYFADVRGSVSAIDMTTLTEVSRIKVGWQPHGIAVDEKQGVVLVANRNFSGGIAPHHAAACAGSNGYLSAIDLNTLLKLPKFKPEVSVDPYSLSVRP